MKRARKERKGGRAASSLLLLAFSFPILPALTARSAPADGWTVLLSGDADGYLSPCGCTSPMEGGLRRRATVLRSEEGPTVRLDNGGLLGGLNRQSLLKAETAAQALETMKIDGANLNAGDVRLGEGEVMTLARLSNRRLLSTSLRPSATVLVDPWREAGPFLIGGATARPAALAAALREEADPPETAAGRLVAEAQARGLAPILLFDGDRDAARALARAVPALRLVTYRTTAHPSSRTDFEGSCALATPGERGKVVVGLAWRDGAFVSTTLRTLGPEVPDDPKAQELYRRYLKRVEAEHLLEALHPDAKGFAGSKACLSCHREAAAVWQGSRHAHALKTLELDEHGRDPECVPCHVVGTAQGRLNLPRLAYRSREATPNLANVGCESCHGAGAAHVAAPRRVAFPKIGSSACLPCHSQENSPNFNFSKYWAKVKH